MASSLRVLLVGDDQGFIEISATFPVRSGFAVDGVQQSDVQQCGGESSRGTAIALRSDNCRNATGCEIRNLGRRHLNHFFTQGERSWLET